MKASMYKKFFPPTMISYIVICFLVAVNLGRNKTSFEIYCGIFGGISAGNLSDNLIKLIQWLISFLPLLLFLGMQFSEELSGRLYLTISRSGTVLRWWTSWVTMTLSVSCMFSIAVFVAGFLSGITFGEVNNYVTELESFIWVFSINIIYNFMFSLLTLCFGVWFKDLKWSMLIILVIIFACYILGKFVPNINLYLFGSYSMTNRSQMNDNVYGFNNIFAIILMLIIITIAYSIGFVRIKELLYKIND